MNSQYIKIKVIYTAPDIIEYRLTASNKTTTTSLEFYGHPEEFQYFSGQLLNFPTAHEDTITFELGSNDSSFAYHLLIKVFCHDRGGWTAILIQTNDQKCAPSSNKTEFYIKTYPGEINRLGEILKSWNPLSDEEIIWTAESW
jgi:hypothetical protein